MRRPLERIVPRHELRYAKRVEKGRRVPPGGLDIKKWVPIVRSVAERLIAESIARGKPFKTKNDLARAIASAPDLGVNLGTSSIESVLSVLEREGLRVPKGQTQLAYAPEKRAEILQFYHAFNGSKGKAAEAARSKFGVGLKTLQKWLKQKRV